MNYKIGQKLKVKRDRMVWPIGTIIEITEIFEGAIWTKSEFSAKYISEYDKIEEYYHRICQECLSENCSAFD